MYIKSTMINYNITQPLTTNFQLKSFAQYIDFSKREVVNMHISRLRIYGVRPAREDFSLVQGNRKVIK